ncbi:MAG: hypothetical protein ABIJ22_04740 [Patescibacteria group bacterium]
MLETEAEIKTVPDIETVVLKLEIPMKEFEDDPTLYEALLKAEYQLNRLLSVARSIRLRDKLRFSQVSFYNNVESQIDKAMLSPVELTDYILLAVRSNDKKQVIRNLNGIKRLVDAYIKVFSIYQKQAKSLSRQHLDAELEANEADLVELNDVKIEIRTALQEIMDLRLPEFVLLDG